MRQFHTLVFDGVLMSDALGTASYSAPEFNQLLGSADTLFLFLIGDQVTGTPTVQVITEHSPDGKVWANMTGVSDVLQALDNGKVWAKSSTALTVVSGLVRLKLNFSAGASPVAAHIRIWATGRGP